MTVASFMHPCRSDGDGDGDDDDDDDDGGGDDG